MLKFLAEQDESKCCGCGACKEICPKKAISMIPNKEGFMYPTIDTEKCVGCKLCEIVCPDMTAPLKTEPLEIYALQSKNKAELFESSSGGAFRLVADSVINQGGYVAGCVWNDNMEPVLTITNTLDGLRPMQGSKYLSSSTEHTYRQTKNLLDAGNLVLFTGTPCQCAGLLNYLRRPYENLLTMDFLCHGVPSQTAFDAYRNSLKGEVVNYKFRDKKKHGWGHTSSYIRIYGKSRKKIYSEGSINSYDFGFLNGYFSRLSCYSCKYSGLQRVTDFTICDFWGYPKYHKEIRTSDGISAFQVNNQRAKRYLSCFLQNANFHLTNRENVAVENPAILYENKESIPELRKEIYQKIKHDGWKAVEKKYLRCKHYYLKKAWYAMPDGLTMAIKKVMKG